MTPASWFLLELTRGFFGRAPAPDQQRCTHCGEREPEPMPGGALQLSWPENAAWSRDWRSVAMSSVLRW